MLIFTDDTQIGVNGLDEILADLHAEGRQANEETAGEIISRLEAAGNYIPPSDRVRREYAYVLLKEYRECLKSLTDNLLEKQRQREENLGARSIGNGKTV